MHKEEPVPTSPTPEQTAEYTYEMLLSLKELASDRGQETLVALLSAAASGVVARAGGPGLKAHALRRLAPGNPVAGVAFDPAGEFQFEQHHQD